jgi:GrpB-like predicted nucleotidyltransferase (UPF0157 family)
VTNVRTAVPYDTAWAERATHECARLARVSGGAEHIGTTSIPGAHARDVIDLLVGVRMLDRRADLVLPALVELGYVPQTSRMPGAFAFEKREATAFDLFLVELNGREWKRPLALRDYLRRHSDDARAYTRALHEAAAAAATHADEDAQDAAYQEAKLQLIAKFGSRADQWRLSHPRG